MKTWTLPFFASLVQELCLKSEDDKYIKVADIHTVPQDDKYVYTSSLCNIEHDVVIADSLDEAKEEVENILLSYVQDKRIYWEKLEDQLS